MNKKEKTLISASPKVRKFARELGADLQLVKGSERDGRVTENDIKTFIKDSIAGKNLQKKELLDQEYKHSDFGGIEEQPIPRMKKIAGPRLQKSWNDIPHVTQHDEADITEMETFRKSLRDLYTGEKISVTPLAFIIRAVVKALKDYPNFNSSLDVKNQKIIFKKYYHVGIAVDTPHGLMVPKIRDADKKDITTLGKELKKVSKLASELKINKKEFFGGSITISSLGSIGGSFFTPIINQPEVAILGVGRAETKQVFIEGQYKTRIMLPLSLSYDHRIIDGAEGARFCVHLKESLGKDFAYKLAV
jgi:pyruvate dehydrogenase E2 component (dihydrolipoamide acetyltransferase)